MGYSFIAVGTRLKNIQPGSNGGSLNPSTEEAGAANLWVWGGPHQQSSQIAMATQRNTVSEQKQHRCGMGERETKEKKKRKAYFTGGPSPHHMKGNGFVLLLPFVLCPGKPWRSFKFLCLCEWYFEQRSDRYCILFLFLYIWLLRPVISIQRLWLSVYTEAVSGVAFLAVFPKNGEDTGSIPVSCLCQRHWRTKYSSQAGTAILP